jgi:osmotically-inducible protein OsmY
MVKEKVEDALKEERDEKFANVHVSTCNSVLHLSG